MAADGVKTVMAGLDGDLTIGDWWAGDFKHGQAKLVPNEAVGGIVKLGEPPMSFARYSKMDMAVWAEQVAHMLIYTATHPENILIIGDNALLLTQQFLRHPRVKHILVLQDEPLNPEVHAALLENAMAVNPATLDAERVTVRRLERPWVGGLDAAIPDATTRFGLILVDPWGPLVVPGEPLRVLAAMLRERALTAADLPALRPCDEVGSDTGPRPSEGGDIAPTVQTPVAWAAPPIWTHGKAVGRAMGLLARSWASIAAAVVYAPIFPMGHRTLILTCDTPQGFAQPTFSPESKTALYSGEVRAAMFTMTPLWKALIHRGIAAFDEDHPRKAELKSEGAGEGAAAPREPSSEAVKAEAPSAVTPPEVPTLVLPTAVVGGVGEGVVEEEGAI